MNKIYNQKNSVTNEKSEKFFLERIIGESYNRSTLTRNIHFYVKNQFEKIRKCVSPLLSFRVEIEGG